MDKLRRRLSIVDSQEGAASRSAGLYAPFSSAIMRRMVQRRLTMRAGRG
jgi:hypothetical protein